MEARFLLAFCPPGVKQSSPSSTGGCVVSFESIVAEGTAAEDTVVAEVVRHLNGRESDPVTTPFLGGSVFSGRKWG